MTQPADPAQRKPAQWNKSRIEHVQRVVAVASGKGGVGKSTVAVNLAVAAAAAGHRVGILDADIYGPSVPRMLGVGTRAQPEIHGGKMIPPTRMGVELMSMGLLMHGQAAVWRGPMVTKTLAQLLRGTQWGSQEAPLELLLVDVPPGTGDVHLSMAQQVPIDGVVIVTTPQEVATEDADKAAQMFQKLNVPILGVIENMSFFADPAGTKHRLFGEGGGKALAAKYGVPLLGELPLDPTLGECADRGDNFLSIYPNSACADAFRALAAKLVA